jgi:hypothetical protein
MKYHFIPARMAIMKNTNDNKHKGNPHTLEYKCSLDTHDGKQFTDSSEDYK